MADCRVSGRSVVSQVVYGNRLVQVVFVSTIIRTGRVMIELFQPVCVTGRVNIDIFFITLNSNLTLTRSVDTICHDY